MLTFYALIFFVLYVIPSALNSPVIDSENVGTVQMVGKEVVVTGQTIYPYVVFVGTFYTRNTNRIKSYCTGVIISENAILTAAHCLHKKVDLEVVIRAGVVDVKTEKDDAGQELKMKNFLIHKNYEEICPVLPNKCCVEVNDIAIIWTEKKFKFGKTVKIATLNKKGSNPVGKKGYIVGWGRNEENKEPAMLQRGLVKVIDREECKRFNPKIAIADTTMCLGPVDRKTSASNGDSGGPFVRKGVVYGLSSTTLYNTPCHSNSMDLYTYVAEYSKWIKTNLELEATAEKTRKSSTKASSSRTHSHSHSH